VSALDAVRRVADAVLYEGYLLYPYRASAAKNRLRWQFGVLSPAGAAEAGLGEQNALRAQFLLRPAAATRLTVRVRFLQVQDRVVQSAVDGGFADVDGLRVGDASWVPWQEAVGRELAAPVLSTAQLLAGRTVPLGIPGGEDGELLPGPDGAAVGRLVRIRQPLAALLSLAAEPVGRCLRVTVILRNTATWDPAESTRDKVASRSLVSAHLLVDAAGGELVSVVDPPADAVAAAASCENAGWWPVLVGRSLLVAPIVLPEQPEIAPESPGDLFDATEIDEILTLRVMTMTDEEKAAARGTDPRAAAIVDRCDTLPPDVLAGLHGARRDPTPAGNAPVGDAPVGDAPPWWDPDADAAVSPETDSVPVAGVAVRKGSRVRLRPTRRADAQDIFLAGQVAVVTAVLSDVDGQTHVAVVLEDDPAADLHDWSGRYWYFAPDEIEPLPAEVSR
jgi:hypothetical protein